LTPLLNTSRTPPPYTHHLEISTAVENVWKTILSLMYKVAWPL
jgi:hypothetical protein